MYHLDIIKLNKLATTQGNWSYKQYAALSNLKVFLALCFLKFFDLSYTGYYEQAKQLPPANWLHKLQSMRCQTLNKCKLLNFSEIMSRLLMLKILLVFLHWQLKKKSLTRKGKNKFLLSFDLYSFLRSC